MRPGALALCLVALVLARAIAWPAHAAGGSTAGTVQTAPPADIATSFDAFWSAADGRPFAEQLRLWDELIERPRQDVYGSVVWQERDATVLRQLKERVLARRFAVYPTIAERVSVEARRLESQIPVQNAQFRAQFPRAAATPPVQLILAPQFDAKSGVLGDGSPVLVFAVDSLVLEHADLSVIFPHELFHLYNAQHAGIENDGVMAGANLTLPLFAEGMATYVSSVLAPGHTDGQLLLQKDLGEIEPARLTEIAARFLRDADQSATDAAESGAFARWFEGARNRLQPDLPNRSGYWLGLQLVRRLRTHYSLQELAAWSPTQAQERMRVALLAIARP